ncbi:hypothetical protein FRC03_012897 [Tulasnella sp. 419]|nr:hypothetical protein FRC03_012897 [Tulasnella sp. 419]
MFPGIQKAEFQEQQKHWGPPKMSSTSLKCKDDTRVSMTRYFYHITDIQLASGGAQLIVSM